MFDLLTLNSVNANKCVKHYYLFSVLPNYYVMHLSDIFMVVEGRLNKSDYPSGNLLPLNFLVYTNILTIDSYV